MSSSDGRIISLVCSNVQQPRVLITEQHVYSLWPTFTPGTTESPFTIVVRRHIGDILIETVCLVRSKIEGFKTTGNLRYAAKHPIVISLTCGDFLAYSNFSST